MWLKTYAGATPTGRIALDKIVAFEVEYTSAGGGGYVIYARVGLGSLGYDDPVVTSATLPDQATAFAELDDILLNGN